MSDSAFNPDRRRAAKFRRDAPSVPGLSRNSVIFGYERLISEGYLTPRPMVGTFVAEVLPDQ